MARGPLEAKKGITLPSEEMLNFEDLLLKVKAEVCKTKGNDEYRANNISTAINFYTEGIAVNCIDDELNAKLYSNRATANFYLGNYRKSLNDAKAAVELKPNYFKAIIRGASACLELGLYKEAITWCDKGLVLIRENKTLLEFKRMSVNESDTLSKTTQEGMQNEPKSKVEMEGSMKTIKKDHDDLKKVLEESKEDKATEETLTIVNMVLGLHHLLVGDSEKAIDCFKLSLQNAVELGNRNAEGIAYRLIGEVHCLNGNFRQAVNYLECCLKICKEVGNRLLERDACCSLGNSYHRLGELEKALSFHKFSLKIIQEMNDKAKEGVAYGNIGVAYHGLGDFKKAIHYHELQLKIAIEVGDRNQEGNAYGNLGCDYSALGDVHKAIYYDELCLGIAKEMRNRHEEGRAYGNLAISYSILGDFNKATDCHKLHLSIAKEMKFRDQEGNAYHYLGFDCRRIGDLKGAIHYHDLQLKIAKEVDDRVEEGRAYGNLGVDYCELGDLEKAIHYCDLYIRISKETGDHGGEGIAHGYLGACYLKLRDFKTALGYYETQLRIAKEVSDRSEEGRAYSSLRDCCRYLGDFKTAVRYHELSLAIAKDIGNKYQVESFYCNLGTDYCNLGDLTKAIHYYELSLEVARKNGNRREEGGTYNNLGAAFFDLGEFEKAIHYHERSLEISEEVAGRSMEGFACANLGNAHAKLGDFRKAIPYHERALEIAREVGDKCSEGDAYNNLGNDYGAIGNLEKSLAYHTTALEIARSVGNKIGEAHGYSNLGREFRELGCLKLGIHYHSLRLEMALKAGDKPGEVIAYQNLGADYYSLGDYEKAAHYYELGVKASNDFRASLKFKDEWKVSLRHQYQSLYSDFWRVLLRQGKILEALTAAEQGRAQALRDLMEQKYGIETPHDGSCSLEAATNELLRCLPPNTVFTAFNKGEVFFWVIRNGKDAKLRSSEICDHETGDVTTFFHSLVMKAFENMGVRAGVKCEDRSLDKLRYQEFQGDVAPDQTTSHPLTINFSALKKLYGIVIAPIADLFHGDELVIVPEGPLWLTPYAAFMDSNSNFLGESFKIRLIPSLTSLKLIADCKEDYHHKTGALLVGDPWVEEIVTPTGRKLLQLPCAREEVQMIGRILKTTPLTGRDATKDEVLKRLASVALVHIAAHGRMETGEIALSPNPLRETQLPREGDYLLKMSDVLNVKLRARLVVLSCCHSGRGDIKAEGVVGIARAFLGAGARSVLVSLWAIDDEATLEFMKIFYHHLMEGRSSSEALKQTMKTMRESDEFSELKYWAPFVLIGDDVTLEFGGRK